MPGAVQLAAADADRAHLHQDIALGHLGLGHVLQLEHARPGEHQCLHLGTPVLPIMRTSVSGGIGVQPRKGWHSWPVTPGRQANSAPAFAPGPPAVLM